MEDSDHAPSVTVVVPARNESANLPRCLASLREQAYRGSVEIIVVDNASTDDTAEVARRFGATVVFCQRRGVVHAREAGFRAARGDVLLQTDADTVCPPDWIARHVVTLREHPEAVAVSGEVNYEGEPAWHTPLTLFARTVKRASSLVRGAPLMVFAANMAVLRQALVYAGGYGVDLPHCADESLLRARLLKQGRIVYDPSNRVSTSSRRFKGRCFRAVVLEMGLGTLLPLLLLHLSHVWRNPPRLQRKGLMLSLPQIAVFAGLIVVAVGVYGYFVPSAQVFGRVYTRQNVPDRVIALTFDDGPDSEFTEAALDILADHGVQATFFLRGGAVADNPEIAQRVVAEGHEVGNHSWSHPAMATPSGYRNQLTSTQNVIQENTGVTPTVFRAPYGRKTPWLLTEVKKQDMITVGWSISAGDTQITDPKVIAKNVISKAKPGAIVLLHDGTAGNPKVKDRSATIDALPLIIEALLEQGYRFVTVSDLLDAPMTTAA